MTTTNSKSNTIKGSAINKVFIFLILSGIFTALITGSFEDLTKASFDAAKSAVNLSIGLIGAMALWLGLMKVAEKAGLLIVIARKLKPIMTKLFPDVPGEHPAMSAMILNMASNILGLGNAATPFGIKAMEQLDKLNQKKGIATNAMCLFLAINTSSVTILPLGVIAIRSAAGCTYPAGILLPTMLSTICSTIAAIIAAKFLQDSTYQSSNFTNTDIKKDSNKIIENTSDNTINDQDLNIIGWRKFCLPLYCFAFFVAGIYHFYLSSDDPANFFLITLPSFLIPFLIGFFILYGISKKIAVYETLCQGAKEGFNVAIRILPFLVAILVAIAIFRSSGALEILIKIIQPLTSLIGMPADTLPMALVRPLSGSGAFGVMSDLVNIAPNSKSAFIASIMQGSTETTFYVLAVYFGAIGVTKARHAVIAALIADFVGIMAAVFFGSLFYTSF